MGTTATLSERWGGEHVLPRPFLLGYAAMTLENVIPIPSLLDRLANRIRGDLKQQVESRETWVEATLDLCIALAEARTQFPADIAFGQWCEASGFGKDVLNDHDRAAAIKMGQYPDEARQVLGTTERRSLRYIYEQECRFGQVAKPTTKSRRSGLKHGNKKQLAPELEARVEQLLLNSVSPQIIANIRGTIAKRSNVSDTVVRRIKANLEGALGNALDLTTFSETQKDKFDRALRAAKLELRAEIKAEVENDVRKVYEEHVLNVCQPEA